jgi:AAA domain
VRGNVVPFPPYPDAPKLAEFRPFYVSQLEGKVPAQPEWLVDGVLLRQTVGLFSGPPKIGKSLLLQQLLTALACGEQWLNRAVIQCRTFGFFTEDPLQAVERRQHAMNAYYGKSAADFELEMSLDARAGKEALLVEFEGFSDRPKFTPLWYQLWNYVRDEGIVVVGLDTAAVIYGGRDYRGQVTPFMRELNQKAIEANGAVILSTHPSKADATNFGGVNAWLASARFGMSMHRPSDYNADRDEPRDIRILRGLGANYGVGMRPQRLQYRDGVFEVAETEDSRGPRQRVLTHQDRIDLRYRLLAGVKRVILNGGKVPAEELHRESLANRARRSPETAINQVAFNDLYVAQREMIEAGQLVRVDVGHRCLLRPADGPYYPGENPWLPAIEI